MLLEKFCCRKNYEELALCNFDEFCVFPYQTLHGPLVHLWAPKGLGAWTSDSVANLILWKKYWNQCSGIVSSIVPFSKQVAKEKQWHGRPVHLVMMISLEPSHAKPMIRRCRFYWSLFIFFNTPMCKDALGQMGQVGSTSTDFKGNPCFVEMLNFVN